MKVSSRIVAVVLGLGWALATPACGCFGSAVKRPYAAVPATDLVSALKARNTAAKSFRSESKMDYRVGGERVKGTVLIAGEVGSKIRFNAENPTGGSVAVDMACDGWDFRYINNNENCQLTGPCTEDAIAQLLQVRLKPDEFMLLAVGGVPLMDHEEAKVEWKDDGGRERVTLKGKDGSTQVIELSGQKDQRWDVVSAVKKNSAGKVEWKLRNKDFKAKESNDGKTFRVPGKSLFEQPLAKADLLVEWKKHEINIELPAQVFQMEIPEGLPVCGQKK